MIELLAYLAAENGNNFKNFKTGQIDSVVDKLRDGKTMEMLAQDMKYYVITMKLIANSVRTGG